MAVTSEASSITNFPLRTFDTGCSILGEMPTREQKTARKSAAERLTESRGKFVCRGSRDELEEEDNRDGSQRVGQVTSMTPSYDEKQGPVYRAVPVMCMEDGPTARQSLKDAVSRPPPPPPVPDKPQQAAPAVRKASRDRTLEIVEASLALSLRQSMSSDDDATAAALVPPQGGGVAGISPKSNSPQSAGSRVRKLREQFLKRGSTESESDTSQGGATQSFLQKSDSSSDSPQEVRKGRLHDQIKTAHRSDPQSQTRADTQHQNTQKAHPNQASVKAEKDKSQRKEQGMNSEARHATVPSTEALSEQTKRQMERFKARYATDISGENSLGRKINKIVLKPKSQTVDRKEQSSSADEVSHKSSSSSVRPRSHTSEEESSDHTLGHERDLFTRPQAPVNVGHQNGSWGDKRPNDDAKQGGTDQTDGSSKVIAHNTSRPMTSEEVRRLRRAKEHNVSGKSPERWGDSAETVKVTAKPQRSVIHHAVHHSGDRVVAQVSGKVFPTKHQVSDSAFQTVLQPQAATRKDLSLEVVHRRVKSDLDESSAAKISMKAEASSHRPRHRSQDDYLQDPVVEEPRWKVSSTSAYLIQASPSPNTITDFKKKSWAPISFNQSQERTDKIKIHKGQGNSSQGERAVSPDPLKDQATDPDLQTPRAHQLHKTPRKIYPPENSHERAKANVQNFLSGIISSPSSRGKMPVSLRPPLNDGNGNPLTCDVSSSYEMPSSLMQDAGNINEVSRPTGDTNEVNSNVYLATGAEIKPVDVASQIQAPEDIKLRAMNDQKERFHKKAAGKDADTARQSRGKNEKNKDKGITSRMDVPEQATAESDKRQKFSQKSDISSSKQKVHSGRREEAAPNAEEQRAKKVSLAELLGRDAQEERTEQPGTADPVRKTSRDSKWTAPLKPEKSHGDNSETDSDVELQQSKVLRVRRPQRRAENKKEDKSLENLLSRIINPEDDLNTLKRGQKLKPLRNPEAQTTHSKSGQTFSSSTGDSENEGVMVKTKKDDGETGLKVRRPLLNLNLKQTAISNRPNPQNSHNSRILKNEAPARQPEPLTSPTRHDFRRQRSKSDLGMSPRCSVSSAQSEVERFFNQMGLNESFFQNPLSPGFRHSDEDEVFHEMHEYKFHRGEEDGSFSTEHSDNISHGSKVSEEGLHLAKKLPDTSQSIITKNARVIKWLCQMKKARASSIS